MIVEVIGFSSVGKSTLVDSVMEVIRNEKGCKVVSPEALLLRLDTNKSQISKLETVKIDIITLLVLPLVLALNLKLFHYVISALAKADLGYFRKVNLFRNFAKKQFLAWWIRQKKLEDTIVLCDEGVLQSAINILVHAEDEVNRSIIKLLTYPDIVIILNLDNNKILNRLQARKDRPQWTSLQSDKLKQYINRFSEITGLLISDNGATMVMRLDWNYGHSDIKQMVVGPILREFGVCECLKK